MVRDLRCIYSSMEKNYRENQHKHPDADVGDWVALSGTTIAKRVDTWSMREPVGTAIERLKTIIDEGIHERILFIKFEDLTVDPETELGRIYDFLEVSHFKHDFDNVAQITKENDAFFGASGNHTIRAKVEPVPKQYNKYLGQELSRNIVNSYSWFYEYFGYTDV